MTTIEAVSVPVPKPILLDFWIRAPLSVLVALEQKSKERKMEVNDLVVEILSAQPTPECEDEAVKTCEGCGVAEGRGHLSACKANKIPAPAECEDEDSQIAVTERIFATRWAGEDMSLSEKCRIVDALADAYRRGFRAGHSKPIDGFHRDGCGCEECVQANSPAIPDGCDGDCTQPGCRGTNPAHPEIRSDIRVGGLKPYPPAIPDGSLTADRYMAERGKLVAEVGVNVLSGYDALASAVEDEIAALDARWQAQQEKPPPASEEPAWNKCCKCGCAAIKNGVTQTTLVFDHIGDDGFTYFRCADCESPKSTPPPASDEGEVERVWNSLDCKSSHDGIVKDGIRRALARGHDRAIEEIEGRVEGVIEQIAREHGMSPRRLSGYRDFSNRLLKGGRDA